MSSPSKTFTGRYPPETLEAMRKSARRFRRSLNAEMNLAVDYYLAALAAKAKAKPLEEAAS